MPTRRKPAAHKALSGTLSAGKGIETGHFAAHMPLEMPPKCPSWIKSRRGRQFFRKQAEAMVAARSLTAENADVLATLASLHGQIADASATGQNIQATWVAEYRRTHEQLGLVQSGQSEQTVRPGNRFAWHGFPTWLRHELRRHGFVPDDFGGTSPPRAVVPSDFSLRRAIAKWKRENELIEE